VRPRASQDLTQGFFALLIERNYLLDADPKRGRFRSFLLAAVKHFLPNERDRANALRPTCRCFSEWLFCLDSCASFLSFWRNCLQCKQQFALSRGASFNLRNGTTSLCLESMQWSAQSDRHSSKQSVAFVTACQGHRVWSADARFRSAGRGVAVDALCSI